MTLHRLFSGLLAGILLIAGCSPPAETVPGPQADDHDESNRIVFSAEAYDVAQISVVEASFRPHATTVQVTGSLTYNQDAMAISTARVGGRITRVVADYGQTVRRGDTLAWIDSPDLSAAQADYLRSLSISRLSRAEHERAMLLLEGDAISRGELLRREAQRHEAEADLSTAVQKLHILGLSRSDIDSLSGESGKTGSEYPVRALIDGRVTERQAIPGRVVSAAEELFTVARLDSLWLFLQVFEKDLPAVTEGASVSLTCESHPDHRFAGTIDFVGQILDPHSRTVRSRAVIGNQEEKLKPGMFVYASIETSGEEEEPRLVIPVPALVNMDGRDAVFVQKEPRSFELRHVTAGERSRDWVEILSGLTQGERIAVEGTFTIKSELLKGDLEEHDH